MATALTTDVINTVYWRRFRWLLRVHFQQAIASSQRQLVTFEIATWHRCKQSLTARVLASLLARAHLDCMDKISLNVSTGSLLYWQGAASFDMVPPPCFVLIDMARDASLGLGSGRFSLSRGVSVMCYGITSHDLHLHLEDTLGEPTALPV